MNYKDPENILLIICGSMGIAASALIFRYLFLVKLGFDDFGANLVFIIIFIIGLVFFISYLEVIQKVIPPLFKRQQQVIDNHDIIPESDTIEDIEHSAEQEEPIENETPLINELDVIREKHNLEEQQRKEQLLETAIQYTQETFAPYTSDENIAIICQAVTDYMNGMKVVAPKSVTIKGLSNSDLFHFGWNIWNRFQSIRGNKQEDIAIFLKIVFKNSLADIEMQTIKKKLTFNQGKYKIKLEKNYFY